MIDEGFNPRTYGAPLGSLRTDGNPWGEDRSARLDWAESLKIPAYSEDTENLFFTCCTHAYDARNKKVVKEMASLLLKGGVDLGVLGTKESCCGDQPHKCGDFSVIGFVSWAPVNRHSAFAVTAAEEMGRHLADRNTHCNAIVNCGQEKSLCSTAGATGHANPLGIYIR